MSRAPTENTTDPAPAAPAGGAPAPPSGGRSALLVVGMVASLTLSLLPVVKVDAELLYNVLTVVVAAATFLLGMWDALQTQWRQFSRARKSLFSGLITTVVATLVMIGTVSRGKEPLSQLSGTRNIAVIGFAAPDGSEQKLFDDVAKTVTKQLRSSTGTEVHDYTSETTPPWKELRTRDPGGLTEADGWALGFVKDTGAKLLLGGYGERNDRGQVSVHIAMYLAPGTFQDVPELGGWYPLSTVVLDRALDRDRTREELHNRLTALVHGTTTFLRSVDTLQTGRPDEAITMLNELMDAPRPSGTATLYELIALFRGHTHQELAVRGVDRDAALARARADYLTVRQGSEIAVRARLSLAGNDYLQAVRGGCEQPTPASREQLTRASETLRAIATDPALPEVARLKAKVDYAQAEHCRERAGEQIDVPTVERFLAEIDADPEQPTADADVRKQLKGFALSVAATRRAGAGDHAGAVELIERALQHDARFERNALWEGLKFAWLLHGCRLDEARAARDRSLEQLHLAVDYGRLPAALEETDRTTFAGDLAAAESRCRAGTS